MNEYPWQVQMIVEVPGLGDRFRCGGSLISNQHVLTAAHCTFNVNYTLKVVLGKHDYTENVGEIKSICAINDHPQYNNDIVENDISILTLCEPVSFSHAVAPVCHPGDTGQLYTGCLATVTGWGRTSPGGPVSQTLQELDGTVTSNTRCRLAWTLARFPVLK